MFCTECGKDVPEGSAFCTSCGAQMAKDQPPGTSPPPPGQMPPSVQPMAQVAKPKSKKTMIGVIIGVVALLVIAAVVLVLVFVVFKGDDKGKAKDFMIKADATLKKVESQAKDVSSSLETLGNEMQAGNITSSQAYNASADKIKSDISDIKDEAGTAKGEYEKIKGLNKGVQDYKDYADLRIVEINTGLEVLATEEEFIDYIGSFLSSVESGGQLNADEFTSKMQGYVQDLTDLGSKLSSTSGKADTLKDEKNL